MAWYDVGTVSVTNGSTTVTGAGTDFISGVQVGEGLYIGGDLYEIGVVNSSTQLTLSDAYLGSTATGQAYKIIPTQSLVADLSSGVADLISDFADVRDYAGNGKFNDGTQASPAITFTQDQNNGLYRIGSDNWGLAAGGAKALEIKTTGVKLDDGKKITFGAGDDLQIYHDGSNSYIKDSGTGNLWIQGSSQVNIGGANGTIGVQVNEGSSTVLRHNNAVKLTTTSTGVDVTGTVTADGLTVDGLPTVELTATDGTLTSFDASDSTTLKVSARIAGQNFSNLQIASDALRNQYIWNNYANADLTIGKRGSVGGSNKNTSALKVASNGDVSFYEDTGTTAKMVWDASAESLGIGTSAPYGNIHLAGGQQDIVLTNEDADGVAGATIGRFIGQARGWQNEGDEMASIDFETNATSWFKGDIVFKTNNVNGTDSSVNATERMRIDSSGNVGIGDISPDARLHVNSGSDNLNAIFESTDTAVVVQFKDTTGTAEIESRNDFRFKTNGLERARIDNSGNLLVGKSSSNIATSGVELTPSDRSAFTRANGNPILANRTGSVGEIINLRKDGSTVGSIGVASSRLYIGSDDTGLFTNSNSDAIQPFNTTTGTVRDGLIGLGTSGARFKDLYLSGGVYLGGTGAANKLDDYEQGNFTPTMSAAGATITFTEQFGKYVKIGDVVHVQARITVDTVSGGAGAVIFGSLPFTADSANYYNSALSVVRLANFNIDISAKLQNIMVIQGQDFGYLYYSDNTTGNSSTLNIGGLKGGSTLVFSGTYKVA